LPSRKLDTKRGTRAELMVAMIRIAAAQSMTGAASAAIARHRRPVVDKANSFRREPALP
jgi:hypothetical protein